MGHENGIKAMRPPIEAFLHKGSNMTSTYIVTNSVDIVLMAPEIFIYFQLSRARLLIRKKLYSL